MKKLNNSLIIKLIKLRKAGESYKEISEKLNISKSTVHNYCFNIVLSKKARIILFKKENINRLRFVNEYAKLKKIKKSVKLNINKVRIISHCLFDGSLTKYNLNYTNSSKKIIDKFMNDVYSIYGIKPTLFNVKRGKYTNKYTVYFCSKLVCDDLFRYSPSYSTSNLNSLISKEIFNLRKSLIRGFLRCFWEDEGCITIKGEIIGRIRSKNIRDQLILLHNKVGVYCKGYDCSDNMFGIRIYKNKTNLLNFNKIGFGDSIILRGFNKGVLKQELFEKLCIKKV